MKSGNEQKIDRRTKMSDSGVAILMVCMLVMGIIIGGFIVSTACSDVGHFYFAGSNFDCSLQEVSDE